jgi:aminoglycoside phosphotransferase (APT) family kinase protein
VYRLPAQWCCVDESLLGGPFAIAEYVDGRTVQTRDELDVLGDAELAGVVGDQQRTQPPPPPGAPRTPGGERGGRPAP